MTCCLEFALALLLALSPVQLRAECAALHCQQQPGYDCMSAYGALQVAQHLGLPAHSPQRWDWGAVDAAVWDGVVLFAWPWAEATWTPDGPAHAFYCQGDVWLPVLQLRLLHCWDVQNPAGTWWSVKHLQRTWTGWAVVK